MIVISNGKHYHTEQNNRFKMSTERDAYQFHLQTKYALEIYLTVVNKVRGLTGGQVGAAFLQVLSDCEPGRE